jgi:phage head maturation protease
MATIQTHKFYNRAAPVPGSFNEKENSVDIIFATEEPVLRPGWMIGQNGNYNEILSINPQNIRNQRSDQGLPLFINHDSFDVTQQIGKVVNIQYKNKKATGTAIFGARMDAPMKQDIKDGILSSFSVGYQIYQLSEVKDGNGDTQTFRATDWEPLEISLVGVPADPNATTREAKDNIQTQIINNKMTIQEIKEKGTPEQMERLSQIRYVTRKADLSDETIQQLFDSKDAVEDIERKYVIIDNTKDIERLNKLINK